MNHPLPKDKITVIPYIRQLEGFDIQFDITTTLFGEVLGFTCPILELPATAQRLMFGGNFGQISAAVKGFTGIFSYVLPLISMGYLDSEEWQPLKEQLDRFKSNQPIPSPATNYIQQDWVKKAYELHEAGNPKRQLIQVAKLLTKETDKRYGALRDYNKSIELDYYDPTLFGPVILRLLPISKNVATIHSIYQALATYPTDTVYLLLSSRLINPEYKKYHASILKGLQPYQKTDFPSILSQFHKNTPLLGGDALKLFIESTTRLPASQQKALLFEVLTSDNRQAALKVHAVLTEMGVTEKELAEKLYPAFLERRSLENMRAILKLYQKIADRQLIPKEKELIAVLQWANTDQKAIGINLIVTYLLRKRAGKKGVVPMMDLLGLLKSNNHKIQEAAMQQIRELATTEHLTQLTNILGEINEPFQSQLLYQTKKLLGSYSERQPIQPLLDVLENAEQLKVAVLKPIKQVLRYRQNEIAIEPLIKELSNDDPTVRKNALVALRVFKEEEVVKAIEKVAAKDDHTVVRKIAHGCLEWIANPLPESRKLEQEHKEKIENYLEEMIANAEKENGKPLHGVSRFAMKLFGRTYYKYFPKDEWQE